jgi:long-chain acyl-CoA synthetase
MTSEEVHLSYLPLAHIFETAAQTACYSAGGRVGFSQGNPKLLTLDLLCIRPTMLCGVPRVFDKMYKKIFGGVADASFIKRWLFNSGYSTQCENVRKSAPRSEFYDNKIFKPLAEAKLGLDRCRLIITGAAPCPPYLMEFLKVCIDCIVVQGYGMTESSAGATFQLQTDPNTGHVGPPLPCNEIKLVDVPEMGYHSSDKPYPRGEVCVRGSNVFQGYYKAPDKTAETLVDGWLHTGDIGRWNPNGSLSIIDRKKNIFKLSQGEYVAAEKIELVYAKCALVGQVWIYGNSFKSFLLAVVAPNAEPFYNVAVEKGWMKSDLALGSDEFLAAFKAVFEGEHKDAAKKVIFEAMKLENKNLKGFEKVRDIVVEGELDATLAGFTEAKGTMTPTFKLRRPQLLRAYLKQLKEAYTANGEPPAADEVWPGEEE